MALVAKFNLQLQQKDVKTAFPNRDIEEKVYMQQPKVLSEKEVNIWCAS